MKPHQVTQHGSGRLRATAVVTLHWEMIKDLYWILNSGENYCSGASGQTSSNDDDNLYNSLAYDFQRPGRVTR